MGIFISASFGFMPSKLPAPLLTWTPEMGQHALLSVVCTHTTHSTQTTGSLMCSLKDNLSIIMTVCEYIFILSGK